MKREMYQAAVESVQSLIWQDVKKKKGREWLWGKSRNMQQSSTISLSCRTQAVELLDSILPPPTHLAIWVAPTVWIASYRVFRLGEPSPFPLWSASRTLEVLWWATPILSVSRSESWKHEIDLLQQGVWFRLQFLVWFPTTACRSLSIGQRFLVSWNNRTA